MDPDELKQLVEADEGHRVELKTSLSEASAGMESLCAFLNADGGCVIFGVTPKKAIIGVDVGANGMEQLSERIAREIDPPVYPEVDRTVVDGKEIVYIATDGRRQGVVYFVRNKPLVRVGSTNKPLSAYEVKYRHLEDQEGSGPSPRLPDDWCREENAPEFYVHPGSVNGVGSAPNKLSMSFRVTGADVRPRFRWLADGVTDEWLTLTPDQPLGERKYSVQGGTVFEPSAESGTVGFEVEFPWKDTECHALWEFPYHLEPKNTWVNLRVDASPEHLRHPRCWRAAT